MYLCRLQFLGFGLLLTSLWLRRWRETRFGPPWLRSFLADYGVPLMVVAWSSLSYALRGAPPGIPRRVLIPNTWDVHSIGTVVRVCHCAIYTCVLSFASLIRLPGLRWSGEEARIKPTPGDVVSLRPSTTCFGPRAWDRA